MTVNESNPETGTKIDRLKEDDPIPRQNWVCVSFLSPESVRNCTLRGLKIRGVYETKEEARERCEELQITDPNFHVFVGEVGKWLPWDSDPNSVKDQHYQQKELQDLMKGYEENLTRAKKMQDQRREDMVKNAAYDNKSRKEETQARLLRKLEKKKAEKSMNRNVIDQMSHMLPSSNKMAALEQKEKALESKTDLGKQERDRLYENDTGITNQKSVLSDVDDKLDKLNKIKALYDKVHSKSVKASN